MGWARAACLPKNCLWSWQESRPPHSETENQGHCLQLAYTAEESCSLFAPVEMSSLTSLTWQKFLPSVRAIISFLFLIKNPCPHPLVHYLGFCLNQYFLNSYSLISNRHCCLLTLVFYSKVNNYIFSRCMSDHTGTWQVKNSIRWSHLSHLRYLVMLFCSLFLIYYLTY